MLLSAPLRCDRLPAGAGLRLGHLVGIACCASERQHCNRREDAAEPRSGGDRRAPGLQLWWWPWVQPPSALSYLASSPSRSPPLLSLILWPANRLPTRPSRWFPVACLAGTLAPHQSMPMVSRCLPSWHQPAGRLPFSTRLRFPTACCQVLGLADR